MKPRLLNFAFLVCAAAPICSANVALIVEEAVGGAGEFTGSGHAAVYFDRICADDPVTLRMCRPGEEGVVLSAYPDWGQEVPFRWMAVPLHAFLYGTDDPKKIPLYANGEVRLALRDAYRKKFFRKLVPDNPDGSVPEGRWREVIGVALNRDVFALTAATTPAQDEAFLKKFSDIPNTYAFNTMFNNCADFARETLNLVFTKAVGRDFVNDFGMTTPKALARSFTQFAADRPGLGFYIERYPQIDGTIRRSLVNRNFTEKGLTSKKYALTMITTKPEVLAAFALTYFISGWYHLDAEYHERPTAEIAQRKFSAKYQTTTALVASTSAVAVVADPQKERARAKADEKNLRASLFGDDKYWKGYQKQLEPMLSAAFQEKLFLDREEFKKFYKDVEIQSEPQFDANGNLTLRVDDRGVLRNLGITEESLLSPDTDLTLAYKLMLVKVNYALTAPSRNRLTVPAFEKEWQLLQTIAVRRTAALAASEHERDRVAEPARFRQHEEVVSGSKRAQKLLMEVTH